MLTNNYVTCHMIGRLGNQLFQIANAYAQSLRHNRQLVLPKTDTSVNEYFDNVYRKLNFLIEKSPEPSSDVHYINATYHYTEYTPALDRPTVFKGYFESEKYFKDYANEIKQLYGPAEEFVNEIKQKYPQLSSSTNAVINVRRGDFLNFPAHHPVITAEYIHKAYNMLPKVNTTFVVSDDLQWCKENITLPNTIFVEYEKHKALWFMSLCQNFVISNSTFSWWGAYLSKTFNKTVIVPQVWFGPEILKHTDPKDIYCEDWKVCPAVYDTKGLILPA